MKQLTGEERVKLIAQIAATLKAGETAAKEDRRGKRERHEDKFPSYGRHPFETMFFHGPMYGGGPNFGRYTEDRFWEFSERDRKIDDLVKRANDIIEAAERLVGKADEQGIRKYL